MKKTIIILALLSLVGCKPNDTNAPLPAEDAVAEAPASAMDEADSAIVKAQQSADVLAAVTDETTEKVSSNVQKLTEQIKVYQQQTKTVKAVKQVIVHDTIYIEKKKNFWGKEKTTVNKVSDSTSVETIDSTKE